MTAQQPGAEPDPDAMWFAAAGLTEVDQRLHGVSQFVTARRPEQGTEFEVGVPGRLGRPQKAH